MDIALTSMLAKRKNTELIGKSYILWEHGFPYNTMTCCIFSRETGIRDTTKISPVGEKKAEKESDQKASETGSLYYSL